MSVIPHAATTDTNPKRERGRQTVASFTLRVSIGCLISDRLQYNLTRGFALSLVKQRSVTCFGLV